MHEGTKKLVYMYIYIYMYMYIYIYTYSAIVWVAVAGTWGPHYTSRWRGS